MAITKSAKKALRQSERRRAKNLVHKNKIKTLLKKARALIAAKNTEEAKKLLPQLQKALDKASKTGVIKKNTASRLKSRVSKSLK